MNKKELETFAREAAKSIKTEKDLSDFSRMLKKVTVETALNAELDDHLGYDKHETSNNTNSRNGYSSKTLISKTAHLKWMYRATGKALLSPSWSRNTSAV